MAAILNRQLSKSRLSCCERGNVGMIFACSMVPIMACVGMGVDLAVAYAAKARMGYALDAAVLAVGSSSGTDAQLQALGQKYFDANYKSGLGAKPTVTIEINGDVITARANAQVATSVMKVVGFDDLTVHANSTAVRQIKGLELAMVLDNTGSMDGSNIAALREAAKTLTGILFGENTVHDYLRIALVPYSAAVNPGLVAETLVTTGDHINLNSVYGWKGCVIERTGSDGIADTATMTWKPYIWDNKKLDNNYSLTDPTTVHPEPSNKNASTGPNVGCPTPITPLTNQRAIVDAGIDAMQAWSRGGTMGDIGMAWGLRVLSPELPFTEGLPWNTPDWTKAVIMMTDGDNQFFKLTTVEGRNKPDSTVLSDYTGELRLGDSQSPIRSTTDSSKPETDINKAKTTINTRLSSVCAAMKTKKIVVYTITFTSGINSTTKDIYRNCASDPAKYFDSPTQDDLKNSFRTIANELSKLRLSQ